MLRAAAASMRRIFGVGNARSQHHGLRHIRERDVVGIATAAGDQGLVFETSNGLAYAEFHNVYLG